MASGAWAVNYNGTYTWTAPPDITSPTVYLWGAGGAGGGINNNLGRASGAAGGAVSFGTPTTIVQTSPGGDKHTIVVGTGGTGGTGAGAAGGASTFDSTTMKAAGGPGGNTATSGGAGAAVAAAPSGSSTTVSGGTIYIGGGGGAGGTTTGSGGGGSSAGLFGNGNPGASGVSGGGAGGTVSFGGSGGHGTSANSGTNLTNGAVPGGGGAGVVRITTTGSETGSNGGDGRAQVVFTTAYQYIAQPVTWNPLIGASPITGQCFTTAIQSGNMVILAIQTNESVSSVTIGGVALTQLIAESSGGYQVSLWQLPSISGGAVGQTTVTITASGATVATVTGYEIGNAGTINSLSGTTGSGGSTTLPGLGGAVNQLLIAAALSPGSLFTAQPSSPWVNNNAVGQVGQTAQQEFGTRAGATPTWTVSSGGWAVVGVAIGAPPGNSQGMFTANQ